MKGKEESLPSDASQDRVIDRLNRTFNRTAGLLSDRDDLQRRITFVESQLAWQSRMLWIILTVGVLGIFKEAILRLVGVEL